MQQSDPGGVTYKTPEEVFSAVRDAAQKNDFERILACLTPETLDGMTAYSLMAVVLMRASADKLAERGDNRYIESKKRIDAVLSKYGVDISEIREGDAQQSGAIPLRVRQMCDKIRGRQGFLAVLVRELERAKGGPTTGFQDELVGKLADLEIRGQYAEANVVQTGMDGTEVRKPIFFKRTGSGWRVHLPSW